LLFPLPLGKPFEQLAGNREKFSEMKKTGVMMQRARDRLKWTMQFFLLPRL